MTRRFEVRRPAGRTALLCTGLLALMTALPAAAQERNMVDPSRMPKWSDLPDWSGVWLPNPDPALPADPPFPYKPEVQKRVDEVRAAIRAGKPINRGSECTPPGMPNLVTLKLFPIEIQVNPMQTTIIAEYHGQVLRIYTDGRGHPVEPNPSLAGHTTGEWKNGQLHAETVALAANDTRSEQMVVRHHWYLADANTLKMDMTITDPVKYTKPLSLQRTYQRRPNWEPVEFTCQENNRNPTLDDGSVGVILPTEQ